MTTTEKKLGSWREPILRIVDHMYNSDGEKITIPEKDRQSLIEDAMHLKNLYESEGVVVSSLRHIVEITEDALVESHMKFVVKMMGFRGQYHTFRVNKNVDWKGERDKLAQIDVPIHDLCILRTKTPFSEVQMDDGYWRSFTVKNPYNKGSVQIKSYRSIHAI